MRKTIAVGILVMLAIGGLGFVPNFAKADTTEYKNLWIQMRGFVEKWDDDPAFGWIGIHVRMIDVNGTSRNWTRVHVTWSNGTDRVRLNCSDIPKENFTLVHYAARLVNTEDVRLDYSGYDLYILGEWNVTKITVNIYVDENGKFLYAERTFEPYLPELAEGELRVISVGLMRWRRFELDIDGLPLLSGIVAGYRIAYVEIKLYDLNDDGKVDVRDLVRVAKKYSMVPGLFGYDHPADVNLDDQIDVGDLTTVAANIEG